jgi:hypothetical protein
MYQRNKQNYSQHFSPNASDRSSALCALSRNGAIFVEHLHFSSPACNHPYLPWYSAQPANKQIKIRIKYFQ